MKVTIRRLITVSTLLIALIPLLIIGTVSSLSTRKIINSFVSENVQGMVEEAARITEWELTTFKNAAIDMGCTAILGDTKTTDEERKVLIEARAALHDLERGNYIHSDGMGIDGNDYSEREYFQQSMNGNSWISEPVLSKVTGKLTTIISAPVWKDGIEGSEVVGVVYFVPHDEFLNDIVRSIDLSENSTAYIIDKNGNTIAEPQTENLENIVNYEEMAKSDKNLEELAAIHKKMRNGETGFDKIHIYDKSCYMSYTPINGTNGWSLGVYAPQNDFLGTLNTATTVNGLVTVIGAAIAIIFSMRLGNMLGKPIHDISERISGLADGDVSTPLGEISSNNEVGVLAEKTSMLLTSLHNIINDVKRIMGELSKGNLLVDTQEGYNYYAGEFSELNQAMNTFKIELNSTIREINEASNQVTSNSDQLSQGAQMLAQGATEQADSIGQLSLTLHDITEHIEKNRTDCLKAKSLSNDAKVNVDSAVEKSNELHHAMDDISEVSESINNIIKTIDSIAFQTNTLAINASIEAARAGAAGKGFAVVAEEVNSLASQVAEAVKETEKLIERSNISVNRGVMIAEQMQTAMRTVDECTGEVVGIIDLVARSGEQQAESVAQITTAIDQITNVVNNNTSAAEKTAAASEELNGQAEKLNSLVGRYRL